MLGLLRGSSRPRGRGGGCCYQMDCLADCDRVVPRLAVCLPSPFTDFTVRRLLFEEGLGQFAIRRQLLGRFAIRHQPSRSVRRSVEIFR